MLGSVTSDCFKVSVARRKRNSVRFIKRHVVILKKKERKRTESTLIIMLLWFSCLSIRNHFIYSSPFSSRQPDENVFHGTISKANKSKGNPGVLC